ncbi:hypothetical protein MZM54_01380 [[Brevibacterium] frigoritolerans]|nr:hypothetical protein [Peribacillus frigoritolerans]
MKQTHPTRKINLKIKLFRTDNQEDELVTIPISEEEHKHFDRWWHKYVDEGFIDGDEEYCRILHSIDNQLENHSVSSER